MAGKESIEDLHEADEAMEYHKIPEREAWRVDVLKGTLSLRFLFPYIKDFDPLNTVNTVKK